MKRRLAVALFSAFAIAAFAAPAAQAASVGPATQITDFSPGRSNSDAAGNYHAVAVNPKTGAQIAFYRAYDGSDTYLGAQVFTAVGPVGSEHVVATGNAYAQNFWQYGIAYNPTTGGWLAAYPDDEGDEIIGQLLKADGSNSGSPFTIGTIASPGYAGLKINWNSQSKKFLVTYTSYYDTVMNARFVTGNGAVSGSQSTAISGLEADYCPMDTAYSTKSNTFLALASGGCSPYPGDRPLVRSLSGSGSPKGSARYLGDAAWSGNYAASVAYNAKRDEFGVMWYSRPVNPGNYYLYLQRIKASNGANIGAPIEITPPEGMAADGYRVWASASPSGQYYLTASLVPGTSSYEAGWYSFKVSGTGETVADSLEEIGNGVSNVNRPQNLYNPVTGQFLSTFVASECVPGVLSTTRSTRGQACTDTFNLYFNGVPGSPSGGKPTVKKVGTPGGTSAKIKLGCGGSGKCKIKLSGKLVGGSGKVVPKTVKVEAEGEKSKVKVTYSQELIDELASNGGGRIKLKAKQVGGKSKTIVLTVPASVTG